MFLYLMEQNKLTANHSIIKTYQHEVMNQFYLVYESLYLALEEV